MFENGIEDFSNRLAQRAPDHMDREKLSDGESQVEHKQSGGENSSKASRNETEHTPNASDNIRPEGIEEHRETELPVTTSRNETEHTPNACDNIRQEGIEEDREIEDDNENCLMKLISIISLFCLDVINFLIRKG